MSGVLTLYMGSYARYSLVMSPSLGALWERAVRVPHGEEVAARDPVLRHAAAQPVEQLVERGVNRRCEQRCEDRVSYLCIAA